MTASTTAQVADRVRDAAAHGTPLRVRGRGGWMHANRPVRAHEVLSLGEVAGIVEYVPGDFTMTVRAGTSLGEIAAAALAHGQWLALDPYGDDAGSIGATVATASSGPLATGFGTPRDHLLGVEFVTGAGDVVRGGGRVVKNVAGFDLVRLSTGAWGTLGAITELSVRLRARPAADETLALSVEHDAPSVDGIHTGLRSLTAPPMAAEMVNGALAAALDLPERPALLVRIGGNAELMRSQRDALGRLGAGPARPVDGDVWRRLRTTAGADTAVWRMSHRPSSFGATWMEAHDAVATAGGGWMHGSPMRGIVRCGLPALDDGPAQERLTRIFATSFDGVRIGETLPAHVWSMFASPAADGLSRRVREAFDPSGILNPGILGESA